VSRSRSSKIRIARGAVSNEIVPFCFSCPVFDLHTTLSCSGNEGVEATLQSALIMRQYIYSHDNQDAPCGALTG
jgi:hypothetical protein